MSKNKKKVIQNKQIDNRKQAVNKEDPFAYKSKNPVWSFKFMDTEKWKFISADNLSEIIEKLKTFEGLTWYEIENASGGRSHGTNNHFEPVSELIPEARKRWAELKHDDYDNVFSLRLEGTERLYGIVEEGIFKIIWYDPSHEIYPSSK